MPILVKPLGDPSSSGNPLNRPTDGFDPTVPYQMIPIGQSREMVVQTGAFKAEMSLTIADVSSMSNFRSLRPAGVNPFPLLGPNDSVRRIVLPERSVIQFTLKGRALGFTVLEGRDRPSGGVPPLRADFKLGISVKRSEERRFAVCYVFDRVNRDTGARRDFVGHLAEADRIFRAQANFSIVNVDGLAANTRQARSITLNGTMGKTFDLDDTAQISRIIDEFDARFPGISAQVHTVVFSIPVPIGRKSDPKSRVLGVSIHWRRRATGRKFSMLLVGPQEQPRRATQGGPQPSEIQRLRHTIAHEIGHSFGLEHDPETSPPLEVGRKIKEVNPIFFTTPQLFNLMFPNNFLVSNRITGAQVEIMHLLGPQFREIDL